MAELTILEEQSMDADSELSYRDSLHDPDKLNVNSSPFSQKKSIFAYNFTPKPKLQNSYVSSKVVESLSNFDLSQNSCMDFSKFVSSAETYSLHDTPSTSGRVLVLSKLLNNYHNKPSNIKSIEQSMDITSASLASFERNERNLKSFQNENSFVEERLPSFICSHVPRRSSGRIKLNQSNKRNFRKESIKKCSPRMNEIEKSYDELENSIIKEAEMEFFNISKLNSYQIEDTDKLEEGTFNEPEDGIFGKPKDATFDKPKDAMFEKKMNEDLENLNKERDEVVRMMLQVAENDPDISLDDSRYSHVSPIISREQPESFYRHSSCNTTLNLSAFTEILNDDKIDVSLSQNDGVSLSEYRNRVTFCLNSLSHDGKHSTQVMNSFPHCSTPLRITSGFGENVTSTCSQLKSGCLRRKEVKIVCDSSENKTEDITPLEKLSKSRLFLSLKKNSHSIETSSSKENRIDVLEDTERIPGICHIENKGIEDSKKKLIVSNTPQANHDKDIILEFEKTLNTPIKASNQTVSSTVKRMFKKASNTPKVDYETNVDFGIKQILKTPDTDALNETVHITRKMFQEPPQSPKADYETNVDFGIKQILKTPITGALNDTIHVTRKMFHEPPQSPKADYETNVDFGIKQILKTPDTDALNETVHITRKMFQEPPQSPKADYETNVDFGIKQILKTPITGALNDTIHVTRKMFHEPPESPKADYKTNVDFGIKQILKTPDTDALNETVHITRKMFQEPPQSPKADYETNIDFALKQMLKTPIKREEPFLCAKQLFQSKSPQADYVKFIDFGVKKMLQRSPSPMIFYESDGEDNIFSLFNTSSQNIFKKRLSELFFERKSLQRDSVGDVYSNPEIEQKLSLNLQSDNPENQAEFNFESESVSKNNNFEDSSIFLTKTTSKCIPKTSEVPSFYLETRAGQKAVMSRPFEISQGIIDRCRNINEILISQRKQKSETKSTSLIASTSKKTSTRKVTSNPCLVENFDTLSPAKTQSKSRNVKTKLFEINTQPEDVKTVPEVLPKKTRGRPRKTEKENEDEEDVSPPKIAKIATNTRKKVKVTPIKNTRGRKKKIVEDDLAELAGFHQEVEDARLDKLIFDAANGTACGRSKSKATSAISRNRKLKADIEQDQKLSSVVTASGDCDVKVLEEFVDDDEIIKKKAKTKNLRKNSLKSMLKLSEEDINEPEIVLEKPKRSGRGRTIVTETLDDLATPSQPNESKRTRTKRTKAKPEVEMRSKNIPGVIVKAKFKREEKSKSNEIEPEPEIAVEDDKHKRVPRAKKKYELESGTESEKDFLEAKTRIKVKSKQADKIVEPEVEVKPKRGAKKRPVKKEIDNDAIEEPEIKTTRMTLRRRK